MSSAGRAASSSGCVTSPRGRETGLTGYAEQIQRSLPTGGSAMETAEHREPYESRGSGTELGAPGGESPPGESTRRVVPTPRSSVGSRFSKRTLVGTLGNGRDAPIPAVRETLVATLTVEYNPVIRPSA